jgi:hypothetical protein
MQRSTIMNINEPQKFVYARRRKRYSSAQLYQLSVIFAFFLLSTLISLMLSLYFARLPLQGF